MARATFRLTTTARPSSVQPARKVTWNGSLTAMRDVPVAVSKIRTTSWSRPSRNSALIERPSGLNIGSEGPVPGRC